MTAGTPPAAKRLMGYSDRFSVRPGKTIAFKVSSEMQWPYRARIVRLIHGDINPAGPGYIEAAVPGAAWSLPGRRQTVRPGSCAVISGKAAWHNLGGFRLAISIWPTTPEKPGQALASLWDPKRGAGFVLSLDGADGLVLDVADGAGLDARVALRGALAARHWYRVEAYFEPGRGLFGLRRRPLGAALDGGTPAEIEAPAHPLALNALRGDLVFAAKPLTGHSAGNPLYGGFYNGKLEAPEFFDAEGVPVGRWDFALGIETETIHDVSGRGLHGRTWQLPARGMTGATWDGSERHWRHAPQHYGAIHFHDDDLKDAGWETDFAWTVPAGLRSGLYAAHLEDDAEEDHIPFVVRPAPTAARCPGRLLFLVPQASYLAYANEHLALDAALAEVVHDHLPSFGPNDIAMAVHREFGGSLYDRHSDGSGIFYSTPLRPILNMRPKYQSWLGGTGSGLWQLNADTHLLAWLEHLGVPFDCIADEDLDREGAAALAGYACVMTGTHAEYWSTAMRDALDLYRNSGGRIMHMGGNGLYWRIAYDPNGSGAIEVRRCEVGNGWITAPGESHHSFNGEYGGLWRRIGRPPQASVGVGFVGQGFDRSSYYRRLPASYDPRAAFIFEGVENEIVGDYGLIGGGAAGIELDRTDPLQGTPAHALILARSENHGDFYLPTVEELLINYVNHAAISPVFAEMVYFEAPKGGGVFATGSIAWAGSLSHQGYQNDIARITGNVLKRFLDPTPLSMEEPT